MNKVDPLFVDLGNEDYHLQPGSPCIDTGNNLAPQLPGTDMDGQPRMVNGIVDMGAYEHQGALEIAIEIRPWLTVNLIVRQSPLSVPVAIVSSPTFDAPTEVDHRTLTFGRTGDEPSLHFCESYPVDVNHDGKKLGVPLPHPNGSVRERRHRRDLEREDGFGRPVRWV